jgi:RNA polymerase sigma-70 factor (ECF subfamily)
MSDAPEGSPIGTLALVAPAPTASRGASRVSLDLDLDGAPDGDPHAAPGRTTGEPAALAADLALRLRRREPEALAELYDALGGRAFGLAYRVVGEAAAAEDVVQEAFVAVWTQAERIDPARGRIDSLLMTIVHRRATDHVRARSRRLRHEHPSDPRRDAAAIVDEAAAALLEAVADAPDRERVHASLRALSAEQREAIQLAYFAGLSHSEIAEATATPLGTVKSRLRLGMAHLRRQFGIAAPGAAEAAKAAHAAQAAERSP